MLRHAVLIDKKRENEDILKKTQVYFFEGFSSQMISIESVWPKFINSRE